MSVQEGILLEGLEAEAGVKQRGRNTANRAGGTERAQRNLCRDMGTRRGHSRSLPPLQQGSREAPRGRISPAGRSCAVSQGWPGRKGGNSRATGYGFLISSGAKGSCLLSCSGQSLAGALKTPGEGRGGWAGSQMMLILEQEREREAQPVGLPSPQTQNQN